MRICDVRHLLWKKLGALKKNVMVKLLSQKIEKRGCLPSRKSVSPYIAGVKVLWKFLLHLIVVYAVVYACVSIDILNYKYDGKIASYGHFYDFIACTVPCVYFNVRKNVTIMKR